MKKLNRFKLIGRLINNRANIAAKEFADGVTEFNKKQKKLEELHQIAKEYKAQLTNVDLQMSAEQFKQYHRFIDYLEFIIKQQTEVVAILKREVEKRRQIWVQCHTQNNGLKHYIEGVEAQIIAEQLKKEQKELDYTVSDNFFHRISTDD